MDQGPRPGIPRSDGQSDPDTAQVRRLHEGWRADGYRESLDVLRAKSELREGVSPDRATHLLLFYVGTDAYRVLVLDLGWSHEAWVDWTVASVAEQVFA